jgi:hypothetical protein
MVILPIYFTLLVAKVDRMAHKLQKFSQWHNGANELFNDVQV